MAPVGVVDVGGGHVAAGLVVAGGLVAERRTRVDPHAALRDLLPRLIAPAVQLARDADAAGRPVPEHWAVALPGPFDYDAGHGSFAGVDKFASLSGVDLRASFAEALGTPPSSVRFVNDAVAYAVGEWSAGAGSTAERLLCLTLGTGVGSAFLADGRPVSDGDDVPRDGDVHTLAIDGRPLEESVSTPALRARFEARTGHDRTVEEICALARDGDAAAAEVVTTAFAALGRAVGPWARRFGAETVVVGGGVARSWDVVGPPLARGLRDGAGDGTGDPEARPSVVPAALGDQAPLLGAAAWTLRG